MTIDHYNKDSNRVSIVLILFFLCLIVLIVSSGDDFLYYTNRTNYIVVDKGYDPEFNIDGLYSVEPSWWIDVYDIKENKKGRVYLKRDKWSKTHVGNTWYHGFDGYD